MALSDEELLTELNELAEELGHPPTLQDYREKGNHSVTTYYNHFGSWREALQAAGFRPREPESEIPAEDLRAELRRLADKLNETPSASQMNTHGKYWASTYRRHFGSWNDAIDAAGLTPNSPLADEPISEDQLLSELQRVAKECGTPPTFQDMEEVGEYGARTYIRHFGSWNDAVEAAGFEPNRSSQKLSTDELLVELQRLADDLGERPTSTDLIEKGNYALATYQRHFGSWSAALEAAFEASEDASPTTE